MSARLTLFAFLVLILTTTWTGSTVLAESEPAVDEPTATPEKPVEKEPESDKAGSTSLVQTMQGESGVSVATMCTNCNNADINVAGMGNEFVQVTCDGLPVMSGLGQVYLLSVMPPTVIDKTSVTKGAGSASLVGGAVAGQIEIETRRPQQGFALNASADAGSFGWSATRLDLSGRADWFSGSFVGSTGRSDVIDANNDGNPDLPGFERYTLQGDLGFEIGDKHEINVRGMTYNEEQRDGPGALDFGFDWIGWLINGTAEVNYNLEDVDLNLDQYSLAYEGSIGSKSRFSVAVSHASREQFIWETRRYYQPKLPAWDIDETREHASVVWSRPFGYRIEWRLGGALNDQEVDTIQIDVDRFYYDHVTEKGVWSEVAVFPGSKLELMLGARWVEFTYADKEDREEWLEYPLPEGSKTLPRMSLAYKPTPAMTLRVTAGTGYRVPEPMFESVCCGRRYRQNRAVLMEESQSYGLEFTFQPTPRFRLAASGFRTDFENLIVAMAGRVQPRGVFAYQHANAPEATLGTAALDFRWEAARWVALRGSGAWVDAENRSEDGAIEAVIEDDGGDPVPHTFFTDRIPFVADSFGLVGLDFTPARGRVSISLMAQYTGDMLIQQWSPYIFNIDGVATGYLDPDFYPTESFWAYNFRISGNLPKGLVLYGGVDNISNYVQPDQGYPFTDYNWGPLRGRYYYAGLSYRYGYSR